MDEEYLMEKRQSEQEQSRTNMVKSISNTPSFTPVPSSFAVNQSVVQHTASTQSTVHEEEIFTGDGTPMYEEEATNMSMATDDSMDFLLLTSKERTHLLR